MTRTLKISPPLLAFGIQFCATIDGHAAADDALELWSNQAFGDKYSLLDRPAPGERTYEGYPYVSNYINVGEPGNPTKMHYIEIGKGQRFDAPTIVAVHGLPASAYLWRDTLLDMFFSCEDGHINFIAIDLINHGNSDRSTNYGLRDHIQYLRRFIQRAGLENVILWGHDWGGGVAAGYAALHGDETNISGYIFSETAVAPLERSDVPPFALEVRGPNGRELIIENEIFYDLLPSLTFSTVTEQDLEELVGKTEPEQAFQWPQNLYFTDHQPDEPGYENKRLIENMDRALMRSQAQKLLLYFTPGAVARIPADRYPNTQTVEVGPEIHFFQFTQSQASADAVCQWVEDNDLPGLPR